MKNKTIVDSSGDLISLYGFALSNNDIPNNVRYSLGAKGAALMIKRSIFEELKGFNEKYGS